MRKVWPRLTTLRHCCNEMRRGGLLCLRRIDAKVREALCLCLGRSAVLPENVNGSNEELSIATIFDSHISQRVTKKL